MNAEMASALVCGRLNANPYMQGILSQCLITLEKRERGVNSLRGRPASQSQTQRDLLQDAALQLAIAGQNKLLARELCQKLTPPRVKLDDLAAMSLPNPALSLMNRSQLVSC